MKNKSEEKQSWVDIARQVFTFEFIKMTKNCNFWKQQHDFNGFLIFKTYFKDERRRRKTHTHKYIDDK